MTRILLIILLIFNIQATSQIQVDFTCHGSGYDACDVYIKDNSVSNAAPIVYWFWDLGNGETSDARDVCASYPLAGNYGVCLTVTDAIGNSATSCKSNFINSDSTGVNCNFNPGIEEELSSKYFSIYKSGNLIIINSILKVPFEFILFDQLSRMVKKQTINGSHYLNIESMTSGVYYYRIQIPGGLMYMNSIFLDQN